MATLNKEVWTDQIMKNFYPDTSFIKYAQNFDGFVTNNVLNMAAAGFDPEVLVNNKTYPIPIKERADTPLSMELDLFETENTVVRNPEEVEHSYDKLESVIYSHRMSLQAKAGIRAAHAYAPYQDTEFTPVIPTTGDNNGEDYKRLIPNDILKLKRRYDAQDIPLDKRFLVLDPLHLEDLMVFDLKVFKDLTDFVNGKPNRFAGFNILEFTRTARYNANTMQKKPLGAVAENSDTFCSFSFYADEVMRSDGDMGMYERHNDPEHRGSIIGFDKRFIAMPIRARGIGTIVGAKTS